MTYYDLLWLQVLEEIASSDKCNVGGILLDDDTKEVSQYVVSGENVGGKNVSSE